MTDPAAAAEYLWFVAMLVSVRICEREGADGGSVLEHHAPHGDSPPLHLYRTEDEIFHILEGELRFQMEGEEYRS